MKKGVVVALLLFWRIVLVCQTQYNFAHQNENTLSTAGRIVLETDSVFIGMGQSFMDTAVAIYFSEYDKKTGTILHTSNLIVFDYWFTFTKNNLARIENGEVITLIGVLGPPELNFIIAYNLSNKSAYIKLVIDPPSGKYVSTLQDFKYKYDKYYFSSAFLFNEGQYKGGYMVSIIDSTYNTKHFYQVDTSVLAHVCGPLIFIDSNNIFVFTTIQRPSPPFQIQCFNLNIETELYTKVDDIPLSSNLMWANKALKLDEETCFFTSRKLVKTTNQYPYYQYQPVVVKYNFIKHKIEFIQDFNNDDIEYNGADYDVLIYSGDGNYLYGGELIDDNLVKEQRMDLGVIGKLTKEGKSIWRRTYQYQIPLFNNHTYLQKINDIEVTNDGNLICYGSTYGYATEVQNKNYYNSWLFKIDEDGHILNIDTTSSIPHSQEDLPITFSPNPVSDQLIINQDDITDLMYTIVDTNGKFISSYESKRAFHSFTWDVMQLPKGTYFLVVSKDSRILKTFPFNKI